MIRLHRFILTYLANLAFTLVDFHCYLSLTSPFWPFSLPYLDTYSFTVP
jgi:hypothetical protein